MNPTQSLPVAVGGPIPVVMWKDAFTPRELDAIIAYGDQLVPMKAEIAGRKAQNNDHLRITRVAWVEHQRPEINWLHARLSDMVLRINAEFYRYDLFGLNETFQYTVYEGAEGGHYG